MNDVHRQTRANTDSTIPLLCRPSAATFLLACLGAKVFLTVAVFASGFWSLGHDDFSKCMFTEHWLDGRSFGGFSTWAPLQFILLGWTARLTGDVYYGMVVLNSFWSVGTCLMVYLLGRHLFDERLRRLSAILLICFPWHTWTSISGLCDSMHQCLFVAIGYFLLRWQQEIRTRWLLAAASLMCVLTAIRYEGWMLAIMVSAYLVVVSILSGAIVLSSRLFFPALC